MYGVFGSFTDYPYGLPICCMPKIVINKRTQYFSRSLLTSLDHMYLCVIENITTLRACIFENIWFWLVTRRHVIRIVKYEFNMKTKNRHKKRYFAVATGVLT